LQAASLPAILKGMEAILEKFAGLRLWETSYSALDAYHGLPPSAPRFLAVEGSLIDLAKALEGLEYRGLGYADATLPTKGGDFHLRCVDSSLRGDLPSLFPQLELFREPGTRRFRDPQGIYGELRPPLLSPRPGVPPGSGEALFDAAVLISRYDYELPEGYSPGLPALFPVETQRDLLALVLGGPRPERGLELLRTSGFLAAFWPELALLPGTAQSKEHHPEGDAWDHTLETFRHRKLPDLRLSLALLLHDVGKPRSDSAEGKRFARHAEIGTSIARRFLLRLGFAPSLVDDAAFLVRWHMLPAALPRLPVERAREAIEDPRFPLLLELYRCDELSTFRGPDGYYEACASYRDWLRNSRNPWRDEEGKKLARLYIEAPPPGLRAAVATGAKGRGVLRGGGGARRGQRRSR